MRILNVLLDSPNSRVALQLETQGLNRLRDELQSSTSGQYWIARLDVAAGMTVVDGEYGDSCAEDFRQLVHNRGDQCTASLRSKSVLLGASPQSQLLTDVARLGVGLLS